MNLQEIQRKIHRITHWIRIDTEMPVLYKYISTLEPGQTYLEIGTGPTACSSIFAALSAADGVNVHTVDDASMWVARGISVEEYERKVRGRFADYDVSDRIDFHVEDSIAMEWDGPIHVLFIDGDHSYPTVKADIEKWTLFVPVGCVVIFHDCTDHDGVKRAVNEGMRTGTYIGDGADYRSVTFDWEELDGGEGKSSLCVFRRVK
jgi:hypothetical protein